MQLSFSEAESAAKKRQTRRDRFVAGIETATPWSALVSVIESHYPKGEGRGRRPIGCVLMVLKEGEHPMCSVEETVRRVQIRGTGFSQVGRRGKG